MAEPVVCQEHSAIREILLQAEVPVVSLWRQLDRARQKQVAQWLAEMIRRMRGNPDQERSSNERE
jgi:hypothetical protein